MKCKVFIFVTCLGFMCSSCNPYHFQLNPWSPYAMPGEILSDLNTVDVVHAEKIVLKPEGRATVRDWKKTQQVFECYFRVEGEGVVFRTREIPDDSTNNQQAVLVVVTPSGSWVETASGSQLASSGEVVATGEYQRIQVADDASVFTVSIGCDTLFHGYVSGPCSEFFTMESLDDSNVELTGFRVVEQVRVDGIIEPTVIINEDEGFAP